MVQCDGGGNNKAENECVLYTIPDWHINNSACLRRYKLYTQLGLNVAMNGDLQIFKVKRMNAFNIDIVSTQILTRNKHKY